MKQLFILFLLYSFFAGCKKDKVEELPTELKACFGSKPNRPSDGKVQFENCSENADSYLWNFGDGATSTEFEPTHLYSGTFPFIVTLIAYDGTKSDTISKNVFDEIMVYKPNIYIYPLLQTQLCVRLSFPMGGNIVESIPEYTDGWCVDVDVSGKINSEYDYLFYESIQPNIFQYEKGWCVGKEDLKSFFEMNMTLHNFSPSEIKDFVDYWMPLLTKENFYCIYPQTKDMLDKIIRLDFSAKPDKVYRLFYGIVGSKDFKKLTPPEVKSFERSGYFVVEWGVFRN